MQMFRAIKKNKIKISNLKIPIVYATARPRPTLLHNHPPSPPPPPPAPVQDSKSTPPHIFPPQTWIPRTSRFPSHEEEDGRRTPHRLRRSPLEMGFLEEEMARRRLHEYVEALEDERKKMLVFHRELPFSLELVSRALESYRLQLGGEAPAMASARSDCEEETSSEGLVLKEFIPTTKGGSDEDEEEEDEREQNRELDQRDWLLSVQLHEPQVESPPEEDLKVVKPIAVDATRTTGAFQLFVKAPTTVAATASSTVATEGSGGRCRREEKDGRGQRKTRRCWSPDLHHRFLQALQQLGGSHVATPKQIRELMKVDGLTNDEVKSHLQKYRLHTSRKSPPARPNSSSNLQTPQPQLVFIGSLWTPPAGPTEHLPSAAAAAAAAAACPSTDHVSSFTTLQPRNKKQKLMSCREERSIHNGSCNSESTATTTSSSHTITTTESPRS